LLRDTRPDRLLIEASAAALPSSVLSVLEETGIAGAIKLGRAFTVLARHQLSDPRYLASEAYRMQLNAADLVLTSAASDAELAAARAELIAHGFAAKRVERADTRLNDALNA
jgi:G3E family GTPase